MKIRLIVVGKTTEAYLKTGMEVYFKRLKHYTDFTIVELDEVKGSKKISMDDYRKKEAEKLLSALTDERIVLLDEKGQSFTSFAFAKELNKHMISGLRSMDFVVGGPFGFHEDVRKTSHAMMSISDMTFSHQMIRLFFVEQLYRALTIIKGEKYHHS